MLHVFSRAYKYPGGGGLSLDYPLRLAAFLLLSTRSPTLVPTPRWSPSVASSIPQVPTFSFFLATPPPLIAMYINHLPYFPHARCGHQMKTSTPPSKCSLLPSRMVSGNASRWSPS